MPNDRPKFEDLIAGTSYNDKITDSGSSQKFREVKRTSLHDKEPIRKRTMPPVEEHVNLSPVETDFDALDEDIDFLESDADALFDAVELDESIEAEPNLSKVAIPEIPISEVPEYKPEKLVVETQETVNFQPVVAPVTSPIPDPPEATPNKLNQVFDSVAQPTPPPSRIEATKAPSKVKPWYASWQTWILIILAALLAGVAGWFFTSSVDEIEDEVKDEQIIFEGQAQTNEFEEMFNELNEKYNDLETQLNEALEKNEATASEIETLKNEKSILEQSKIDLENTNSSLNDQLYSARNAKDNAERELSNVKSDLASMTAKRDTWRDAAKDLEATLRENAIGYTPLPAE